MVIKIEPLADHAARRLGDLLEVLSVVLGGNSGDRLDARVIGARDLLDDLRRVAVEGTLIPRLEDARSFGQPEIEPDQSERAEIIERKIGKDIAEREPVESGL